MIADVAQQVEHGTRNTAVIGSNPIVGSSKKAPVLSGAFLFVIPDCGMVAIEE